jgi:hypothetical protein
MALWGNKDSKTASGTIAIASPGGAVTGSSTSFTTQARIGDYIRVSGEDYLITAIASNTAATVRAGVPGATLTVVNAGASYTLSEKPASVTTAESAGSPSGVHGDPTKVFGVDTDNNNGENYASQGRVVEVGVANPGTGYTEVPSVVFTGGGGGSAQATATVSGGSVTSIAVTNTGSSYEDVPTVSIDVPFRTIPTSGVAIATEQFTYATHGLAAADPVKYYRAGGTAITGLSDATEYFVSALGLTANTFRLATTAVAAAGRTALAGVAISGTGGQFTCTATTLAVGDHIRIDGTITGTGSITGHTTGKIYEVSAVTGTSPSVTGFTVTQEDGTAVVSTAGNGTGLTYNPFTIVMISGTGNNDQYFDLTGEVTATAVAALGGGNEAGESRSNITHAGWIRRTTGTGGRAGRVHYETLVAMGSITGDQADDIQFRDD